MTEKVTGFFSDLVGGVKGFLGIHSPSTVFAEIGDNMAQGVGVGFEDEMTDVSANMQKAMGGAGRLTASIALKSISKGITDNVSQLNAAAKEITQSVLVGFDSQQEQFSSRGGEISSQLCDGMVAGIVDSTRNMNSKISKITVEMVDTFSLKVRDFAQVGVEIMKRFWEGFESQRIWLKTKIVEMTREIVEAAKVEMQIISESPEFAEIGDSIADGVGSGFEDKMLMVSVKMQKTMKSAGVLAAREALESTHRGIKENVSELIAVGKEITQSILVGFDSQREQFSERGKEISGRLCDGMATGMVNSTNNVTNKIPEIKEEIVELFRSQLQDFEQIGVDIAHSVGSGFDNEVETISTNMQKTMKSVGGLVASEAIKSIHEGISSRVSQLDMATAEISQSILAGLYSKKEQFSLRGEEISGQLRDGIVEGVDLITEQIAGLAAAIIAAHEEEEEHFIDQGTAYDDAIATGMVNSIRNITIKIPKITAEMVNTFRSKIRDFTQVGVDIMKGFWEGFESQRAWLKAKVLEMMREIVEAARAEMQIASPSKVFAEIGSFMAQGLGVGFEEEMKNVERTITEALPHEIRPENRRPQNTDNLPRTESSKQPGGITIVQNIYANKTNYAEQQREAAKNFRQIARQML